MSKKIQKIVVVGGGSAGWMTASTLITQLKDKDITVIESPNIPTVGVGESTIGGIKYWLKMLNIKDEDFMEATDASYKLAIRFEEFYRKGSEEFYFPFGVVNTEGNYNFKNDWYFKKIIFPDVPLSDYYCSMYPQMAMVTKNKISKNEDGKLPNFIFNRDVAYHFDATKFGLWLKNKFALPKGVKHIVGDVVNIQQNDEGISFLELDNGDRIYADLFIDCTGFKALLIDKTLKEPFNSYSEMLPNNSAWATRVPYKDKEKELLPYTNCTAIQNGWVWNIPLWSRIGTGYVFSDRYISDEDALNEFKNYLKDKGHETEKLEFNKLKFRVGIHRRLWVKNVCAIGLAAGFIEPLESTGLMTIHHFLINLVRTLARDGYVNQMEKDDFSYSCTKLFKGWAEFVAMHYAYSHRDDTEYWRDVGNRTYLDERLNHSCPILPDEISDIANQRMFNWHYNELFIGIHNLMTGMNVYPTDIHSLKGANFLPDTEEEIKEYFLPIAIKLTEKTKYWESLVQDNPSLYEFLSEKIYKSNK